MGETQISEELVPGVAAVEEAVERRKRVREQVHCILSITIGIEKSSR